MKILITDAFQKLDENIIEEMIWDEQDTVKISKFKLKSKIMKEINKKTFRYKRILKTVCLILLITIIPVPVKAAINFIFTQTTLLNDSNRNLIGTEIIDKNYIVYSNGTYKNAKGDVVDFDELSKYQEKLPDNRIINEVRLENFLPSSIVEIVTSNISKDSYNLPEIMLVNSSVCVLTKEDGTGWNLKKGDTLEYNFEKYKSNISAKQTLIVGYVKDGVMYSGQSFIDLKDSYVLKAEDDGEYYVYLLSASSDYLTLKDGQLTQFYN